VLADRSGAGTQGSAFGVFGPRDHVFEVIKPLPGDYGLGLGVDGSGDVLIGYEDPAHFGTQEAFVERFSPHPYGFHDDGTVAGPVYPGLGFGLAASPFNALQVNEFRYAGSGDPALTLVTTLDDVLRSPQVAFDLEGKLFEVSSGPNTDPSIAFVFPKDVGNGEPVRSFNVGRENGFHPIGIAVSN
jgi:hypothetical protein